MNRISFAFVSVVLGHSLLQAQVVSALDVIASPGQYKGRIVTVRGTVMRVEDPFVYLGSENKYLQCRPTDKENSKLFRMSVGQTIEVRGRCDENWMFVMLDECVVLTSLGKKKSSSGGVATPSGLYVGQRGKLYSESLDQVLLAMSMAVLDQTVRYANQGDELGIESLIAAGRLVPVQTGTPVEIVKTTVTTRKVRVLTGPNAGLEGWIPNEMVRK